MKPAARLALAGAALLALAAVSALWLADGSAGPRGTELRGEGGRAAGASDAGPGGGLTAGAVARLDAESSPVDASDSSAGRAREPELAQSDAWIELSVLGEPGELPVGAVRVIRELAALRPEHYWKYGPPIDTDAQGRARVLLPAGQAITLRLLPPTGFRERSEQLAPLRAGETRALVAHVGAADAHRFFGRAIDARSKQVLELASAALEGGATSQPVLEQPGLFRIEWSGARAPEATLSAPLHYPTAFALDDRHASAAQPSSIALQPCARLFVHLRASSWPGALELVGSSADHPERSWARAALEASAAQGAHHAQLSLDCPPWSEGLVLELRRAGAWKRRWYGPFQLLPEGDLLAEIELDAGARVAGRVLDASAQPLAGALVWLRASPPPPGQGPPWTRRTWVADANLKHPRTVDAKAIYIARGRSSAGWSPLQARDEAWVTQSARSDAEGRFGFDAVEPGRWWVELAAEGDGAERVAAAQEVRVEPGAGAAEVVLRVRGAHYLIGHVELGERPATGCALEVAEAAKGRLLASAPLDAQGVFRAGPLEDGRYWVRARGPSAGPPEPWPLAAAARSAPPAEIWTTEWVEAATDGSELLLRPIAR